MYRSHSRAKPLPYDIPQVPVMLGASDVLYALGTQAAWNNRAYAFAILHSYVRGKQVRGKSNSEIHYKLETLEVQVPPHFALPFVEVRDYFGLRKSNVFRVVQRSATTAGHSTTSHPLTATSSRTSNLSRATTSTGVSRVTQALANTASARPDTVRAAGDSDEPPPPPYAAEDPDPESTRILQEQLAAAAANTRNSSEYEMPLDHETGHHRTDSNSSFNAPATSTRMSGDAPQPNDFPASPAARVGNQTSPPESSIPLESTPASRANLSEEERRALEASELDEAMRASRQAEKERLAYEAAIQASIASAEEDSFRRSVQDSLEDTPGAGPSSSISYPAGPSSGENVHRRTAGYNHQPSVGFGAPAIQRAVSSTGMTTGAYGANVNKETPPLPSAQQDDSLTDMFGSINFEAPTLQPTPTGQGKGKGRAIDPPAPMQTQQTGTSRFGSKNPFLTSEERERQQQAEMDAEAAAASGHGSGAAGPTTPPPVPGRPARVGNTPSPRAPDRALPLPPAEEYASPPGAPPGWGQHAPPAGPPPGWQSPPQLTLTTPSRNGTLNTGGGLGQVSVLSPAAASSPADRASRPLPRPTGERQSVPGPDFVNPISKYGSYAAGPAGASPDHSDSESSGSGWSMDESPVAAAQALPPVPPAAAPLVQERAAARAPSPGLITMDEAGENALEMLAEYDTVFLIDDSSSMAGERWAQAQQAIVGVVKQAVRYDPTGVDVYFLNSKRVGKGLRAAEDVEDLFAGLQPRGATPTGLRMEAILRDYMTQLERAVANGTPEDVRAMNLIVVTDGAFACPVIRRLRQLESNPNPLLDRAALVNAAPTDDPESVLVTIARRLDRGDFPLSQVGVQLLQIGDDAEAREALQELDDGLAAAHGVRDMVDTVPYTGEALSADLIVKVLLGGINRRLDRRG